MWPWRPSYLWPSTILTLAVATILSLVVTAASIWYTHVHGAVPGQTFYYAQALFDLGLVTAIVHVTGGADSDFPALYILVITVCAVLMPVGASLLITLLASILYFSDIVWWHPVQLSVTVAMQIGVFAFVAIASGWLASRVRAVGAEHEVLQAEVRRLRLEASDILHNISSGVLTVDAGGFLLFGNPAAEALLGMRAGEWARRPILDFLRERDPGNRIVSAAGGRADRARRASLLDRSHHHPGTVRRRRASLRHRYLHGYFGPEAPRAAPSSDRAPRGCGRIVRFARARDSESSGVDPLVGRAVGPVGPGEPGRAFSGAAGDA